MKILIKFDRILIFQGFERILEGYFDDLLNSKVIKMLIFQCFIEVITELGKGNQRVDRRDMPVFAAEHLFQNVNHAPSWDKNIL